MMTKRYLVFECCLPLVEVKGFLEKYFEFEISNHCEVVIGPVIGGDPSDTVRIIKVSSFPGRASDLLGHSVREGAMRTYFVKEGSSMYTEER